MLLVPRARKGKEGQGRELVSSKLADSGEEELDRGTQGCRRKARIESEAETWLWGKTSLQELRPTSIPGTATLGAGGLL